MEGIETRIGGFVILCMGLAITQSSAAIERLNVAQNLQDDQRKRKEKKQDDDDDGGACKNGSNPARVGV
jgi:hypothetical protein